MLCVNMQMWLKYWKGAQDSWESNTGLDLMIPKAQAGYLQNDGEEEGSEWNV